MQRENNAKDLGFERNPLTLDSQIHRSILTWLTRRDHTKLEIIQKLAHKGHSLEVIEPIVTQMTQNGLINEDRFTEQFCHFRRHKGYGPLRIISELKARGISAEMIAKHLEITDNAWFADAHRVWRKHFKGQQPKDAYTRAKQQRFLQQRGFTWEHIQHALGSKES